MMLMLTFPDICCLVPDFFHKIFVMYDYFCWVKTISPLKRFIFNFCVLTHHFHSIRSNENLKVLAVQITCDLATVYLDVS